MVSMPNEILDTLVREGICNQADILTVDIKVIDDGGITDSVDCSLNSTFEVSFRGGEIRVFVKVNFSRHAYPLFNGELHSLEVINRAVSKFAPTPLLAAPLTSATGAYIITNYISVSSNKPPNSHILLARLLSRMHDYKSKNGKFGFSVPTMCRPPPEYNDEGEVWTESWEEYFSNVMMLGIINKIRKNGENNYMECAEMAWKVLELVVPKLLRRLKEVKPVLLHTDLWQGNWAVDEKGRPVIFDPACFYGHSEFDLSIMRLWGDYSDQFWEVYHSYHPRNEPYFNERQLLYQFWHYLNHFYYFGSEEYYVEIDETGRTLIEWAQDLHEY